MSGIKIPDIFLNNPCPGVLYMAGGEAMKTMKARISIIAVTFLAVSIILSGVGLTQEGPIKAQKAPEQAVDHDGYTAGQVIQNAADGERVVDMLNDRLNPAGVIG